MWRATKASLLAHKLRLLLTALAVAAGVGFVAGTLVLTDTLGATFTTLFEEVSGNKSVIVSGVPATGERDGPSVPLPESAIERIGHIPGVAAARGDVFSFAQLVGPDGKPVSAAGGAPTFGTSYQEGPMSSTGIARGKAPKGPEEMAIDKATAERLKVSPGARLRVITITGIREYTLVGILTFGQRDNLAGATQVSWDLPTAQQALGRAGRVDAIDVLAERGVAHEALRDRIAAEMGPEYKAQTGEEAAASMAADIKEGLAFFSYFLGGFAVVSLLVGSFIIVNTFSILVAQRTRELALFRALGASRRQVLGSVLSEAMVTGLIGSLAGVVGGVVLAVGIKALFASFGLDLPAGLPVVKPRTVLAGVGVGLVVTTAAAVVPALRASQVPPVAAMSGTAAPRSLGVAAGALVRVLTIAAGIALLFLGGGPLVALGALLAFVGVILLLSLVASPLAAVAGYPLARLGVVGRLGQTNATRNPRRTASTAAALMIGLALVGGAATLQASASASIGKLFDEGIKADYILEGSFNGLSPALSSSLTGKPGIARVASLGGAQAKVAGTRRSFSSVSPDGVDLIGIDVETGSVDALRAREGVLVSTDEATDRKLSVGDTLEATFPLGSISLKVGGIYRTSQLAGPYLISSELYRRAVPDPLDFVVLVRSADGQKAVAKQSIDEALDAFPAAKVQTREEFVEGRKQMIAVLLGVVVILLVLSVLIAVLGVINTLALSVYERVREIGLLRAVGSRRSQVAWMVVVESVLVAVIGGFLGLVIGTGIGGGAVAALRSQGLSEFRIPYVMIVAGLVFSTGAGLVASLWPAFRATRLNILESIAVD